MKRPSRRFNLTKWQNVLVPFALAVLGLVLAALIIMVLLVLFGVVSG